MGVDGYELFGFEIQHIIPQAIVELFAPQLAALGIKMDSIGNLMPLLSNAETAEAFKNAPAEVQDAMRAAGWGFNSHDAKLGRQGDKKHQAYSDFIEAELRKAFALSDPDQARLQALDVIRFATKVSIGEFPDITIHNADPAAMEARFNEVRLAPDFDKVPSATPSQSAIDGLGAVEVDLKSEGKATDLGGGPENVAARKHFAEALLDKLKGYLTPDEHGSIVDGIRRSVSESKPGLVAHTMIALFHAVDKKLGILDGPPNTISVEYMKSVIAAIAENLPDFVRSEDGALDLGLIEDYTRAMLDKIKELREPFVKAFNELGDHVIENLAKSMTHMATALKVNFIGDVAELLNASYDALKHWITTGDPSQLYQVMVEQGEAMVIGAVIIVGATAAAAAVAGPAGAAIVAAGFVVMGAFEAVTNAAELIGKILTDVDELVQNTLDSISEKVFAHYGMYDPIRTNPVTGEQFVADDLSASHAAVVVGDERNEELFGINGSTIRGGAGDDILHHYGYGEMSGGEGDDTLLAFRTNEITAYGGAGNDIILADGGYGGVFAGGNGRDWIYVTSKFAKVYGDTFDGVSPDGTDLNGAENSDKFWWYGGVSIMDARENDQLALVGYPLVGGNNGLSMGLGGMFPTLGFSLSVSPVYFDFFLPFVSYMMIGKDLHVVNMLSLFRAPENQDSELPIESMVIRNFNGPNVYFGGLVTDLSIKGDLGMVFKSVNPGLALLAVLPGFPGGLNRLLPMLDELLTMAGAITRVTKALQWSNGVDPLILDLDGDGIETIDIDDANVWFDLDGDLFAEKTGWLKGDDGFLVRDLNNDGKITDINEMFGGPGESGLADLAQYDANGDEKITAADAIYSELKVWRDRDGDGETDTGEMISLASLGIVEISVQGTALNVTTPQGATLAARADFVWSTGQVGRIFDAIFEMNDVDTKFNGNAGIAGWLGEDPINARGFGEVADLAVAMSNDPDLAKLISDAAAAMDVPDIRDMRAKTAEALGRWGMTLDQTRELFAVRVGADGKLADHAVWIEDAQGGYWALRSGAAVLAADGAVIARPTLEQVLAQGSDWRLEEGFSPSSRATEVDREEAPYLIRVENGRVVVLDYGIQQQDGSWRLASGRSVVGADGLVITAPTKADILAMTVAAGEAWRIEETGFNPLANLPVEEIGVMTIDGKVVDYTVEVTDAEGTFLVWARNLDQALEKQFRDGNAFGYNLRAKAVDLATLDITESDEESGKRIELLTPGQFNFATELSGVEFNPAMLMATWDRVTGVIAYTVNDSGSASLNPLKWQSAIEGMIELLDPVMDQYIIASRAFALRIGFQGGLSEFFPGLAYDAAKDQFYATQDRSLAPMFQAIFNAAPDTTPVEITAYLQDWHKILSTLYPDFRMPGEGNLFGMNVSLDQRFIFQMMLPAFQAGDLGVDVKTAMYALGINQDLLRTTAAGEDTAEGTSKTDYFLLGDGALRYEGGMGSDVYFVGQMSGELVIADTDYGAADELRFTNLTSKEVVATRVGQDLILTGPGLNGSVRVKDHFLGELNFSFNGRTEDKAMKAIIFADGVLWDQFRIAMEVSDPQDDNQVYAGSGSLDVLNGGKGNDVLQGGAGGDIYVFAKGDGDDVINDFNASAVLPSKAGLDFIQFTGDLTADDLILSRAGESDDLLIELKNKDGSLTGDSILVQGQFDGMRLNLGALLGGIDPSLGIDYIAPNLIEKILFEDGTWLDWDQITARVLESARTDGSDVVYGFIDADTIGGGKGDDLLIGREGGDTYTFGKGDGIDVVRDGDYSIKMFGSSADRLKFLDGITWGDLEFIRSGASDTLELRIAGTNDTVILKDQEETGLLQGFINLVEEIQFGNGAVWSYQQLFQHFVNLSQTDGADTVYGFHTSDLITGGLGDDFLQGQGGSDRYVWRIGDGSDRIFDAGGATDTLEISGANALDFVVSRTATDLILTHAVTGETLTLQGQYNGIGSQPNAIEFLQFADRTVRFTDLNPEDVDVVGTNAGELLGGSAFGETLDGRGGNDTLEGGLGGDTYLFDAGYGNDVIIDRQFKATAAGADRVVFGAGLQSTDALFAQVGDDLLISFANLSDTVLIKNHFRSIIDEIEGFVFRDRTFTAADIEQILQIENGNRGDNELIGSHANPNTLDGRQGFDTLIGGTAADTYAFGIGYDFDQIIETGTGTQDKVVFGEGVTIDQLKVRRDGLDLLIDLGNGTDVLKIVGGLGTAAVETFSFADGTSLSLAEVRTMLLIGDDSSERIVGFNSVNDVLDGGRGDDQMEGGTGNDTYRFGHGDGQDAVLETGGSDRLEFKAGVTRDQVSFETYGTDLVIRLAPGGDSLVIRGGADASSYATVETFAFADGTALTMADVQELMFALRGNGSTDLVDGSLIDARFSIAPGAGLDAVRLAPTSQYVFGRGDGIDTLSMPSFPMTGAEIRIDDFAVSDVRVRLGAIGGTDLVLDFPATGDAIILKNALAAGVTFPDITFADGTVWNRAALVQAAVTAQTSDRDDLIKAATNVAVTINGGQGDDEILGGTASDLYRFSRGDGQDVITDAGGNDRLEIRGYTAADLKVSRLETGRQELVLTFEGSDDEIVLRSATASSWNGIETIAFGDGTTVTVASLLEQTRIVATSGSDVLTGTSAAETITGGAGDDSIDGGTGSDTFVYRRGDGNDVITNFSDMTLQIEGYAPGEVKLFIEPSTRNYVLRFEDGGSITVASPYNLQTIRFENGTVWSRAQFGELLAESRPEGLSVAETYVSYFGAELIVAKDENEIIDGSCAAAEIRFEPGTGHDVVYNAGGVQISLAGYDFADCEITPDPLNARNLILNFPGSSDRITIVDAFGSDRPSSLVFADRTLSYTELVQHVVSEQVTAGDDRITANFGNDTVAGLAGNDIIRLGDGNDVVRFTRGDGQDDVISSQYWASYAASDRLEISGYGPADLIVERHPTDIGALVFRFAGTSDQIIWRTDVLGDDTDGSAQRLSLEAIHFIDSGEELTKSQILAWLAPLAAITGTASADFIYGTLRGDTIEAGAGDDTIMAGWGNDTIVFGAGDGNDLLLGRQDADYEDSGEGIGHAAYPDGSITLRLRGLNPGDVRFEAPAEDQPVRVIILATGEELHLQNHVRIIAQVEFADGTIWNGDEVAGNLTVTTLPSEVYIPQGYELLSVENGVTQSSAVGDDYLELVSDGDAATLIYGIEAGRTTGHDLVPVDNAPTHAVVAVSLTDVASTDVEVRIFGNEMVLTYPGSDASLTLRIYPDAPEYHASVQVAFSDDVTLDIPALLARAGSLAANDPARAQAELVYDRATMSGSYWLEDVVDIPLQLDVSGIAVGDISYAVRGNLLVVTIVADASTGLGAGIVHIPGAIFGHGVELTADGATVATLDQILTQAAAAIATTGDDRLESLGSALVTLEGGLGNDTYLAGGSETEIVYTRGDGDDLVLTTYNVTNLRLHDIAHASVSFERQGSEIVMLIAESAPGAGDGGIIRFRDQYTSVAMLPPGLVRFDDGTEFSLYDVVVAAPTSDLPPMDGTQVAVAPPDGARFELGHGDDLAIGSAVDDVYIYRNGDGHDVIRERRDAGASGDRIELPDLLAGDLAFLRDGGDLVIRILADAGRGIAEGSIRVESAFLGWFNTWASATEKTLVESIQLADGSILQMSQVIQGLVAGAATAGDDLIPGSGLSDTLVGGAGNDTLSGREDQDSFVYTRGDGDDEIHGIEDLVLHGISATALSARLTSEGLRLQIAPTAVHAGDGGSILIAADNLPGGSGFAVQTVTLDDGTVLSLAGFLAEAINAAGTDADNHVLGSSGSDTIVGRHGNDTLVGNDGDDTYVYARGDGFDVVSESHANTTDVLRLTGIATGQVILRRGAGDNLELVILESTPGAGDGGRITVVQGLYEYGRAGIEEIVFDDGTVWQRDSFGTRIADARSTPLNDRLIGSATADTLAGGRGNDHLEGREGNDLYLFARGDGADDIQESAGLDTLRISGYTLAEAELSRRGVTGADLIIRLEDGDQIVIIGAFGDANRQIERIEFADTGEVILAADLPALIGAARDLTGDDEIIGTAAADTIHAGPGDDLLDGGQGNDTYIYQTGDGDDRIADSGASTLDRLILDIPVADLAYALRLSPDSTDVVLRLSGARDRIVLTDALGTGSAGIEEIVFADGTVWTRDDLRAATLRFAETAGNDNLWGYQGTDRFDLAAGDDTVQGGGGDDLYVVERGDGSDRIIEAVNGGNDRVEFRDYVSSEVHVQRLYQGSTSIVFRFLTSDEVLIVENALAPGAGVESYVFSDGVTWTPSDIATRLDNTSPEAQADGYFSTIVNQPLVLSATQLLRNDFDADGDTLTLIRADGGPNGVAEIDAQGNLVFHASAGFAGPTQITYTISDGRGGFAEGTIDLRVRPIAHVNDDTGFTVAEGGSLQIRAERLLSNDADGDFMVIGQVRDAIGGTVTLSSNGTIIFVADPDFNGVAQFTYVANTPDQGVGTGIVRINVSPVNDAPIAQNDGPFAFNENSVLTLTASQLLANDTDIDSTSIELIAVAGTADVAAALSSDGTVTLTPRSDFFGPTSVTYTIRDSAGLTSTASINLNVLPVNSVPEAVGDVIMMTEDVPIFLPFGALLGNDLDTDGDVLSITSVTGSWQAAATLYENGIEIIPGADFFGTTTLTYRISDGQGGFANGTVTLNIAAVNDNPVATNDTYSRNGGTFLRGSEDQPLVINILDLLANDHDVETTSLTFQNVNDAAGGTISMPGNGTIIFTPDPDFWGEATFSYLVADADGAVAAAEVTLFFENVDDAPPVAVGDTITVIEDTPIEFNVSALLGNDYDIDRDAIRIVAVGQGLVQTHGRLEWVNSETLRFTPGENATTSSYFYYLVTDDIFAPSRGSIEFVMVPVNDEPGAGDDQGFTGQQGVPLVLRISDLMANDEDVEGTDLAFAGVLQSSVGTVEIWQNQFIVVHLPGDFTGQFVLDYLVSDGELQDSARVRIDIAPGYSGLITGSDLVDFLPGTQLGERILGLAGNDTIRAEAGDDTIEGGAGADLIFGGDGFDLIDFAASASGVRASIASRLGQGGDAAGDEYFGIEGLQGSAFGDTLDGGAADNLLEGSEGDDILAGGAGLDTLIGGLGDDVLAGGEGADFIFGGGGIDTADYSSSTSAVAISLAAAMATGGMHRVMSWQASRISLAASLQMSLRATRLQTGWMADGAMTR